jgi:hypothetical protein
MRAEVLCLVLACACSTASSTLRTESAIPGDGLSVAVQFTQEPRDAEDLGIVEAQGRLPAARLDQVLAELTRQAALLGGNLASVDSFGTRYDVASESYTYDCGKTETRYEPRSVPRPGPNRSFGTITEVVPVSSHQAKACNGIRKTETAMLTLRGRSFLARAPRERNVVRRAAWSGEVKVLMEGEPVGFAYDEVAMITATGSGPQATPAALVEALQEEARKLGCNAVIRVRSDRGIENASALGVAVWME